MRSKGWSVDQARDAGLALVLICLLVLFFTGRATLAATPKVSLIAAIVALVLVMAIPRLFKPWAAVWFPATGLLGSLVSKVLLTLVYVLIATPMGLLRRMLGADAMHRKLWRAGPGSVFETRDHRFSGGDLERPF